MATAPPNDVPTRVIGLPICSEQCCQKASDTVETLTEIETLEVERSQVNACNFSCPLEQVRASPSSFSSLGYLEADSLLRVQHTPVVSRRLANAVSFGLAQEEHLDGL